MNRREFLQCAAILITGVSASQLGFTLSAEQTVYLAAAPDYNTTPVNFFTPVQRETVTAMCEAIIPRTDTPGVFHRSMASLSASWVRRSNCRYWKP